LFLTFRKIFGGAKNKTDRKCHESAGQICFEIRRGRDFLAFLYVLFAIQEEYTKRDIARLSLAYPKMIPLFLISVGLLASSVSATTVVCNATQSCPESLPCCNQYGECGTGFYCLGGCHPAWSYDINACVAMPICKDLETDFDNKDNLMALSDYLGDPEDSDWVYSGYLEDYDSANLLAMPNQTSGTVVSSTRFVWYGKVSATFKTSRGGGVVSAFILFSNAQDEIDWEFVGYNLSSGESNYYYQGLLNWTNMIEIDASDTFENYHTYGVDWQEDQLDWLLDGEVVRTLKKADTWNETLQEYKYPQTPSRVQFSLWPAGDSSASGTSEWAGGAVDWNSEDMVDPGYYYVTLKNASIECYDPPAGTLQTGSNAYVFNNTEDFNQGYVMITDNSTVLCDQDSSGLDSGDCSSSSIKSSSSSSIKSSSSSLSSENSSPTSEASTASSTTAANQETSKTSTATGFQQFAQSSSKSTNGAQHVFGGSLLSLGLLYMLI
jgi:beta-glucanase (GH16 family)